MPTEDRRIIFSSEECYKAIYSLCMQKGMPPPPSGKVAGITFAGEQDDMVVLSLETLSGEPMEKKEYSRDFLAAALLLFCRGLGIPIAKSGRKTVMIKAGKAMLRIQIG